MPETKTQPETQTQPEIHAETQAQMPRTEKRNRDGSAWVDNDGSVVARLMLIGVEEERSRWRGSEERDMENKCIEENEMQKKERK